MCSTGSRGWGGERPVEVIVLETAAEVAERSAELIRLLVARKPSAVLGLATGSTPVALYGRLVALHREGRLSLRGVTTFNLDEYVGLDPAHPQSYRHFMTEHLFRHVDLDPARTHLPDGMRENPLEAGPDYEGKIRAAGGIDLQILGIGGNGHIGFNEPTSSLGSRTRVKTLTGKTLADNRRFFRAGEFQPTLAVTMGIATILEAKKILLLATGEAKADAVRDAVEGPVACVCPASALQFHPNATVVVDRAAAGKLRHLDYYRTVLDVQDGLVERFGEYRL